MQHLPISDRFQFCNIKVKKTINISFITSFLQSNHGLTQLTITQIALIFCTCSVIDHMFVDFIIILFSFRHDRPSVVQVNHMFY